ncbi:peptidoglycan DD-metalloendopeptidase family protein [Draconibacterium sp. IB214405]|uniref:murein hydrolase activator EnvC family protein n=1 Tax=Draconibacterium sp. IB214405 TaxID=3097352 RepID=UPI002A174D8A|nr:peptidoglycan DD-metalloendopeptidase family protein [Draconibacterium sp. IB214405]MDX8337825.1 peptidoglycan DD-metalloendopeptidase family protein [Draconibacterium sp. IB214405]
MNLRIKILLPAFALAVLCFSSYAQSIEDLRTKKAEAEKEIEYTTRLLNEAQKNERSSLSKLRLITTKISSRNTLISNINQEIEIYEQCVANNVLAVEMLKNDVQELKDEYAEMIRSAYKNLNGLDETLFLLSAQNFNQAYRRFLYFRRYKNYRENQATTINEVQVVLAESIKKLEQQTLEKQKLIEKTEAETIQLASEQQEQNVELQKLKSQRSNLQKKLQEQRKVEQQLEREITQIIEEEARKNQAAGGSGFALTPEQKLIGDNFEQNRSRLPWPVERGVIVEHFGVHRHPVLTNVQVQNNGINIATDIGAQVRAVFNGEVSRVFGISGGNTAVIIRHGTFLSVYSNLREVVVKKGDKVTTKQTIGTVFTDVKEGNKSILKFQIWKESTKLDPEDWIGR